MTLDQSFFRPNHRRTTYFLRPWDFLKPTSSFPSKLTRSYKSPLPAGFRRVVDGIKGGQTRQALRAYQIAQNLEPSGQFDEATRQLLRIEDPIFAYIEITDRALRAVTPRPLSWKERGTAARLGFHSIIEMIGERTQADPDYLRKLNPDITWAQLRPGDRVLAPRIEAFRVQEPVSEIAIYLAERQLRLKSTSGEVLFHCPVSIARNVEKRPIGELRTTVLVEEPNYTFNPNILTAAAAREEITSKFIIQPGPNNPVGSVWIGLNLSSYGIHGTPEPEKVGRTESSGCFRLANWNAETVLNAVAVDTHVIVYP